MAPFLYGLTSSNINRFSKFFHCRNQEKTCNNTITKDPTTPQVCRYTTLWNVTHCGVRTSRSSSLTCGPQGPKPPGLESSRLRCLRCPSTDGLSTSTIHDNQPAEAGDRHWVGQTVAAFHSIWSRHWSSGVAGLSASSSSNVDTLNIWCKNCRCDSWATLETITETINTLFPVVNFLKCVVTEVVLFSIVAFKSLTFHKVV